MKTQTAINETARNNSILAEKIYQAHKETFLDGQMPHSFEPVKYKTREDVAAALLMGATFPAIWKEVAHHTLGTFQIIALYSLNAFSSPAAEKKFKASFIACIENLLNV